MSVFEIGMVAETGHFTVKREAYEDFKAGGDLESAEMMLFDIIDESAHVQYAHQWLPALAEHAGVDNADYRERGVRERQRRQEQRLRQMQLDAAAAARHERPQLCLLPAAAGDHAREAPADQCGQLPAALAAANVGALRWLFSGCAGLFKLR